MKVQSVERATDANISATVAATSTDVPADTTTADRSPATASTVEPPLPPPSASMSHKPSSNYRSPVATKLRRAHRSRTAELRLQRPTGTGNESRQVPDDRKWAELDGDDAPVFGSETGSVTLSTASARSRTKSDSSVAQSIASADAGSFSSLRQDPGDRWAVAGRGRDRARSLRTSPFGQSPSSLVVRKLKSAAELLRECNELHRQRRSTPASSSRIRAIPAPNAAPQNLSYCVTETIVIPLPSAVPTCSTTPEVDPGPQSPDPSAFPAHSSSTVLPPMSETAISSTLERRTQACSSGADRRPYSGEIHSKSFAVEPETLEFLTETAIIDDAPHSVAAASSDVTHHRTTTSEIPHSTVETSSQSARTARASQSKLVDGNWFHVPKFMKPSK